MNFSTKQANPVLLFPIKKNRKTKNRWDLQLEQSEERNLEVNTPKLFLFLVNPKGNSESRGSNTYFAEVLDGVKRMMGKDL